MTEKMKVSAFLLGIVAFVVAVTAFQLMSLLPPCEAEDATFCYWNAQTMGNGYGKSFITLWEGFTIY